MSCGLGAIVLVFILVKPDTGVSSTQETKKLLAELENISKEEDEIKSSMAKIRALTQKEQALNQSIDAEVSRLRDQIFQNTINLAQKKARVSEVKKSITDKPIIKSSDIISDENIGEEEYLLGLKVEGQRIGFLIDTSSSMTDEHLIDIIKRKTGTDKDKRAGPKWIRAKKVVRWLIARLPKTSQVSIVGYSDNAIFLGGSAWHSANDATALTMVLTELDNIVPDGPTNLHKGLMKMKSLSQRISNLYIITDGLPTTGQSNYSRLNPFSRCFSLLGRGNTISGECRAKLFRQTIKDTSSGFRVPVNVILLPLEGDPEASPNYWDWTSNTGGLLISPAKNWP
ncbi:MAG: VWA domain-containing protein [Gammaproteobacteria bacterium]|nr:MAG: VWA domain-containing protein [Gammaproteobacteria bacterium]